MTLTLNVDQSPCHHRRSSGIGLCTAQLARKRWAKVGWGRETVDLDSGPASTPWRYAITVVRTWRPEPMDPVAETRPRVRGSNLGKHCGYDLRPIEEVKV